jgi:PAS domain-containing protein
MPASALAHAFIGEDDNVVALDHAAAVRASRLGRELLRFAELAGYAVILVRRGVLVYANPWLCSILGVRKSDIENRRLEDGLLRHLRTVSEDATVDIRDERLTTASADGSASRVVHWLTVYERDGEEVPLRWHGVVDAGGTMMSSA